MNVLLHLRCRLTKLINSLILHLNLCISVIAFVQIDLDALQLGTDLGLWAEVGDRPTAVHWATFCLPVAIFNLLVTKHLCSYLSFFIYLSFDQFNSKGFGRGCYTLLPTSSPISPLVFQHLGYFFLDSLLIFYCECGLLWLYCCCVFSDHCFNRCPSNLTSVVWTRSNTVQTSVNWLLCLPSQLSP